MAPKRYVQVLIRLVNVALLGDKGLCRCDESKHFKMRSSCFTQVSPKFNDKGLYKRKKRRKQTQKQRQCDHRGGNWSDVATSQQPPEAGRGKERFSPRASRGSVALMKP